MIFSGLEISAILKLAKAMVVADGKVEKIELAVVQNEIQRFGVKPASLQSLLKTCDAMDMSQALSIVSGLGYENKRYVAAYLGTIMAADMNIGESEMALWRLISTLCGLPTMNVAQAIEIMASL